MRQDPTPFAAHLKAVLALGLPLAGSHLAQIALHVTDTVMDGWYGVTELAAVQKQMLQTAAGSVKPGGRLLYSVCTLTRSETTGVAAAFSAAHPELEPGPTQTLWPHEIDANGMFIAAWKRAR